MSDSQKDLSGSADWYYLEEGATRGPIAGWQLRQLVASLQLPPDTLIWREGMSDWLPANELGLTVRVASPPPPPRTVQRAADTPRRPSEPRGDRLPAADPLAHQAASSTTTSRRKRRSASQTSVPWLWMGIAAASLLVAGIAIGYALHRDSSRGFARAGVASADRPVKATTPRTGSASVPSNQGAASEIPPVGGTAADEFAEDAPPLAGTSGTASPFRSAEVELPRGDAAGARRDVTRPARESPGGSTGAVPAATSGVLPATDESGPPNTLFQEIDMRRRPSFGIAGGATVQDIRYLILSRLSLQPRQANATRTVTQQVLDTRLDRADEMTRLALVTNLEKLKGKTFVYKLGELGDIVEFSGYDSGSEAVPVGREGMSGFLLADVLDEDGWKEMAHLSFLEPDKHIAPGQPWTRQIVHDWGQLGSWAGVTTYTQDSAAGSLPRFRYAHNLTYKPPASTVAGMLPFSIGDPDFRLLEASGWFLYDPTAQHVTEAHETFHVQGGFGSALLGESAKIEIEERQEVSIRLTRQNPWP